MTIKDIIIVILVGLLILLGVIYWTSVEGDGKLYIEIGPNVAEMLSGVGAFLYTVAYWIAIFIGICLFIAAFLWLFYEVIKGGT